MCDLFSWIELDEASQKRHHGCKVLFLNDESVAILRGRGDRNWTNDDVVGHTAIETYYKDISGTHKESLNKIPAVMAEQVRAGKMDKMIAGILGKDKAVWPQYKKNGVRITTFYESHLIDPEWVLKSIVFFCKNYTIDKKDIFDKAEGAINTYLQGRGGNVDLALTWAYTPQGEKFWSALWFLSSGRDYRHGSKGTCKPWTIEEEKAINKMPKVKRPK